HHTNTPNQSTYKHTHRTGPTSQHTNTQDTPNQSTYKHTQPVNIHTHRTRQHTHTQDTHNKSTYTHTGHIRVSICRFFSGKCESVQFTCVMQITDGHFPNR